MRRLLIGSLFFLIGLAKAQTPDGVCARVKVRLSQEITLTRDVFKASLEIHDNDAAIPLEGVRVEFAVTDEAGDDAGGLFQLGPPALNGLGDVGGGSSLPPNGSAAVVYTLKPTRSAAPTADKKYFASGWLRYRELGQEVAVRLAPTAFTVRPDPFLVLDYFWQRDVYSDDPFTEAIEPTEPFSVGLRVRNDGYGVARHMRIKTSQPTIVDNEKGLLIDFHLVGSQVNGQPVSPELLVDLGDIPASSTATARWLLTSSLSGRFILFDASFEHLDGLGDPRVSLIDRVAVHALEHNVRIIDPADDGRLDFLTDEDYLVDDAHLPDRVFNSDGTDAPVAAITQGAFGGGVTETHLTTTLAVAPPQNGFFYVRLPDPAGGELRLLKVVRSDGRQLLVGDNAWTTSRLIHANGSATPENRFYLFDSGGNGRYTLVYGPLDTGALALGTAKTLADGLEAATAGAVVTAVFDDGFYVESLDRSSGIRVVLPAGVTRPSPGAIVTVSGVARTGANGERYLQAPSYAVSSAGTVEPLGANARALYGGDFAYDAATGAGQRGAMGGAGPNPVGLLVRVAGLVASGEGDRFVLDDASGSQLAVQVAPGAATPAPGSWVVATGVVSLVNQNGDLYPLLRLRTDSDLVLDAKALLGTHLQAPDAQFAPGQNLFAIPGLPYDPHPTSVLAPYGDLSGRLVRYSRLTGLPIVYDGPSFGLLGPDEGYRFDIRAGEPVLFGFDALRVDYADRWLSVARTGESVLGHPFLDPVTWESVRVSDGIRTLTLREASKLKSPAWLDSVGFYRDALNGLDRRLGLPEDGPDSDALLSWTAYRLRTTRPNLALIVPMRGGVASLTTLDPNSAPAGHAPMTVVVRGTGFRIDSIVRWNGVDRPTTLVSESEVRMDVSAQDLESVRDVPVSVFNPGPRGGTSNALTFSVTQPSNPAPILRGALPNEIKAGDGAVKLRLSGDGFTAATVVSVNGDRRVPIVVSAVEMSLVLRVLDTASPGTLAIKATNLAPGGGESGTVLVTVAPQPNPLPAIAKAIPGQLLQNGPAVDLTLYGTSFVPGSTVRLNGSPRTTTYVSPTVVRARILPGDAAVEGTATITVLNPTPGGGESNGVAIVVVPGNPVPSLSAIDPTSVSAGTPGLTLSLKGGGFTADSVAYVGGSPRPTVYVSPTELTLLLPGEDLASAGSRSVVVRNPAPGGGESEAQTLAVRQGTVRVNLVDVTSLTRSGSTIQLTAVLKNDGSGPANSLVLSAAKLGSASLALSSPLGTLLPGETTTITLTFPASAGSSGAASILKIDGRYKGATFSTSRKLTLP